MMDSYLRKWGMALVLSCVSCASSQYSITAQRQKVGLSYRASSRIHTKDHKKFCPPEGENILVSWDFSDEEFALVKKLLVLVRFYNQTEETQIHLLEKRRGADTFFFPCKQGSGGILSYKIVLLTASGNVVEEVKSRLWVEKIEA